MNDQSQLFMLCLDPLNTEPVTFKWTVTCERCRKDLSGDYDVSPVNIINIKGNIPPMQMEQFRRAFRKAMDESPRYPLIMNAEDVKHLEVPNLNLQRIVIEHAKVCGQPEKPKCEHKDLDVMTSYNDQSVLCLDCRELQRITCRKPECKLSMIHSGDCEHDGGTR